LVGWGKLGKGSGPGGEKGCFSKGNWETGPPCPQTQRTNRNQKELNPQKKGPFSSPVDECAPSSGQISAVTGVGKQNEKKEG